MEVTISLEQIVNGFLYLLMGVLFIIYSKLIYYSAIMENKENNDQLEVYKLKCSEQQSQLKNLDQDYRHLKILNESFEKFSSEASRFHIVEKTEKRAQELIDRLNHLGESLVGLQKQHENMFEEQQKLQRNLLGEHKLLNEYFENYS